MQVVLVVIISPKIFKLKRIKRKWELFIRTLGYAFAFLRVKISGLG